MASDDNNQDWIMWALAGLAGLLGIAGLAAMNKPAGGNVTPTTTATMTDNPTSAPVKKAGCGCGAH